MEPSLCRHLARVARERLPKSFSKSRRRARQARSPVLTVWMMKCTLLLTCLLALPCVLDAAAAKTKLAYKECRKPNYVTKDNKIYAVDPDDSSAQTEIKIKGVAWSGMEKDSMILQGLWGTDSPNDDGIKATTIGNMLSFLTNNSFNSIRLPLNVDYVNRNPKPMVGWIHQYENRELTQSYDDPENIKYFDFLGRVVEVFGSKKLTVLFDLHTLDKYTQDAFWYTPPYANITDTPIYKAVSYISKAFCTPNFWNVIGIDLKNEMSDVRWDATPGVAKSDWQQAAQALGNVVMENCPSWLVFVGGASSSNKNQRFSVSDDYKDLSKHWDGGNLKNASTNPIKLTVDNKVVYAPHANAHGVMPQNYCYSAKSNCSKDAESLGLSDARAVCQDIVNGELTDSKLKCNNDAFVCKSYDHLGKDALVKNYKTVMQEAAGDLVKAAKAPVILGSFSGVYGAAQPQQSIALDFLIDYAASIQGGYFWGLNPDTEYYLEDTKDKKKGALGQTHYGLMAAMTWQEPNKDLLEALSKIPSSEIPCYGEKKSGAQSVTASASFVLLASAMLALFA